MHDYRMTDQSHRHERISKSQHSWNHHLFGKLKEHEHEILRLKAIEEDIKKKETKSIVLEASSSKASSSNHDSDSGEVSTSEEEMGLFVRRFNRYIQKNGLRINDKNLSISRKAQLKGEVVKEEKVLSCYGCGKVDHLKSECPELVKVKSKSNSSGKSRG